MSDSTTSTCLGRFLRSLFPGRNPVARTSDRIEAAVLLLAIVVPLLALPIAAALGSDTYARESRAAELEASTRYESTAVLLTDAVLESPTIYAGGRQTVQVRAEWQRPDGSPGTGLVVAEAGLEKGSEVRVWLDESGERVQPPRTQAMAAWNAAAVAITAWLSVTLVCALSWWALHALLDRARRQRWQREWDELDREIHGL
ncbi:Rv1733c family protein [Prauserella endophytica]|uniref:Transmembrane protein n=1 Tax=Prauserella endophytica TaxID=1592324 RepID=A0ABY2S631_9PSEU|nr:hypothetical protein [Prauserella endophytica]TKG71121.1 hypothetical protein FCN18_13475 [Prauserella endophytica]